MDISTFSVIIGVVYAIWQHKRWLNDQANLKKLELAANIYGHIYQFEIFFNFLTKENEPNLLDQSGKLEGYYQWVIEQRKLESELKKDFFPTLDSTYYFYCRQAFDQAVEEKSKLFELLNENIYSAKWWFGEEVANQIKNILDDFKKVHEAHHWLCLLNADYSEEVPYEVDEKTCKNIIYSMKAKESMLQKCNALRKLLEKFIPKSMKR